MPFVLVKFGGFGFINNGKSPGFAEWRMTATFTGILTMLVPFAPGGDVHLNEYVPGVISRKETSDVRKAAYSRER